MKCFFVAFFLIAMAFSAFGGDITDKAQLMGDMFTYLTNVRESLQNQALGYAAFAKGGTASATFITTAAISYVIDEQMYTLAASSVLEIATAPAVQTSTKLCIYLCSVDSAGLYTWTKGTEVAIGATPVCPAVPADNCPIAEILVNASAAFTLGTTAFNAGGSTVTATNIRRPRTGLSSLSLTGL